MVRIIKEVSIFFDSLTEKIDNYYRGILFISLFFFAFIPSCKDDPITPPKPEAKLQLTVDDVSCTEAWFSLKTENISFPLDIELMNDSLVLKNFYSINSADTVLYIDSLLPNKPYNFQLVNSSSAVKSNIAPVVTLDTTSHNFTWQRWEFGENNSSVFRDVVILDENNIWAVGEVYVNDSLGNPDPSFFNAFHYDGVNWEPKKLYYNGIKWSISTVYAFGPEDIWFSAFMKYYNGQYLLLPIPEILTGWGLVDSWGTSSNDFYVAGTEGNMAYYNGEEWVKIITGTSVRLRGLSGYTANNSTVVYCTGSDYASSNQKTILKIEDGTATEIGGFYDGHPYTVWCKDNKKIYISGFNTYESTYPLLDNWKYLDITFFAVRKLAGDNFNNIIGCGTRGTTIHFNGYSWKDITYSSSFQLGDEYYGASIKNKTVAIIGFNGSKAVIKLGKQQ